MAARDSQNWVQKHHERISRLSSSKCISAVTTQLCYFG
jgi:hypothetical protein